MSRPMLLFNDVCGTCRALARLVGDLSGDNVELLSLQSQRAKELLDGFYPKGIPFTYFLISERKGILRAYKGLSAALRLAWLLPAGGSMRLLYTYLSYRARSNRFTRKWMQHDDLEVGYRRFNLQKRTFFRTALVGAAALLLSQAGLGVFPKVIGQEIAKQIELAQKEGRPIPDLVVVENPDPDCEVVCQLCSQGQGDCYCCAPSPSGPRCYQVCQNGCAFRCTNVGYCDQECPGYGFICPPCS